MEAKAVCATTMGMMKGETVVLAAEAEAVPTTWVREAEVVILEVEEQVPETTGKTTLKEAVAVHLTAAVTKSMTEAQTKAMAP